MLLAVLIALSGPSSVQDAPVAPVPSRLGEVDLGEIDVVAPRRGEALGGQEPILSLDPSQIQAYGAANIGELAAALEGQTRSARGGSPVFLVNGRRISGFQEIQGLPSEAIERFDVLPEQTALAYGYRADQRVVNVVLKAEFRSFSLQGQLGAPTEGGRSGVESTNNLTRIDGGSRWSMDLNHERRTMLYESERDILRDGSGAPYDRIGNVTGAPFGGAIDPALQALVAGAPRTAASGLASLSDFLAGRARDGDHTAWRTLSPETEKTTLSGTMKRDLNELVGATVSFSLKDDYSRSRLGLPGYVLTLPSTSPYSPFTDDVLIYRYADRPDALERETDVLSANVSTLLDGYAGDWRWTLTGGYDRVESETTTGRGVDAAALQAAVDLGAPDVNPFGDVDVLLTTRDQNTARSVADTLNLDGTLNGKLLVLPAGDVRGAFQAGYRRQTLDSESRIAGVLAENGVSRDVTRAQANFDFPLLNRDGPASFGSIGAVSASLNLGYDQVSDFGGLTTLGGALNWEPIERLSFSANFTVEDAAPSVQQLNDPLAATPNTSVFDFSTGQTVEVVRLTGGAPDLDAQTKRTFQLAATYAYSGSFDLRSNLTYTRTMVDRPISDFPVLTSAIEAALPERFTRDDEGMLLAIDARPLNYDSARRQEAQWVVNFSRPFGRPNGEAPDEPGPMEGMRRGRRGPTVLPGQGNFNLNLTVTHRLQDELVIRPDLPVLDLLNGDAVGAGGNPRNEVQLQGGGYRNGVGVFFNARWREGTEVNGGPGEPDLSFSDLGTVGLWVFAELGWIRGMQARHPFTKGLRVAVGINNLFDARTEVRSSDGVTPLIYQRDYLDPVGRGARITVRKLF